MGKPEQAIPGQGRKAFYALFAFAVSIAFGKVKGYNNIKRVETKSVMTKSNGPLGGYAVNPYVGCTLGCKYCYASFMKRFTGHQEEWGTFLDVKEWPEIKKPEKYAGQKVIIGTVTDGYISQEETYGRTRKILEELKDSGADILICTKYDLVLRDMDLLKEINVKNRVDYFYHEEVRGTANSGKRNR